MFMRIFTHPQVNNSAGLRYVFLCLLPILFLLSCSNDDHGIAPLPGALELQLKFYSKQIPEDTQGVYLFVAPKFPPHAINEMFMSPNSLPLGQDTIYTTMNLPYGHYEAIGLWWYNKKTISNLADAYNLKSVARIDTQYVYQFDITKEEPVHSTDMWVDLRQMNRDAFIEGTITFNGPFPKDTYAVAIAAYHSRIPTAKIDYLALLESMDFSIGENPYHYKLPIKSSNRIVYLVVFWLSETGGLDDFQTLGFYQDPKKPGIPGEIKLKSGKTATGIDILADWNNIK